MKSLNYLILLFAFLSLSCSDDEQEEIQEQQVQLPEIKNETTTSEAVVTLTTVEIKGSIEVQGGQLDSYGVVWSNNPEPTINDNIVEAGTEEQALMRAQESENSSTSFTVVIDNLVPGENYYFRIFAQNEAGVAYGEEISQETLSVAGTKWDLFFNHSAESTWNADVEFYEDGTAFYDEPACPGCYATYGTWSIDGNVLTYNLQGNPDATSYILTGTIEGNSITGTYTWGEENKEFTGEKY